MQDILFESRKIGGVFNEALLLIDRIDYFMSKSYSQEFHAYKFKKIGLCYKVELKILTDYICEFRVPFPP